MENLTFDENKIAKNYIACHTNHDGNISQY